MLTNELASEKTNAVHDNSPQQIQVNKSIANTTGNTKILNTAFIENPSLSISYRSENNPARISTGMKVQSFFSYCFVWGKRFDLLSAGRYFILDRVRIIFSAAVQRLSCWRKISSKSTGYIFPVALTRFAIWFRLLL